jgi:hypothetical protein
MHASHGNKSASHPTLPHVKGRTSVPSLRSGIYTFVQLNGAVPSLRQILLDTLHDLDAIRKICPDEFKVRELRIWLIHRLAEMEEQERNGRSLDAAA